MIQRDTLRVAIVIESFPKLSESFILNQVVALLEKKIAVHIYSAHRPSSGEPVNELFIKHDLARITIYEPQQAANKSARMLKHIGLALALLLRAPAVFIKLFGFQNHFFNKHYLYAVWPLLNRPVYDVVHAHFGPLGVKVNALQQLGFLKSPLICSFHGYDVDRNDFRSTPSFYATLFKSAAFITGNSRYTLRNIEALGCDQEKLVLLPESLRVDYFKANESKRSKEYAGIITVARLVEFKGVEFGLRAAAKLMERGVTNFHYTIIGAGELREVLEQLASDLHLEKQVTFEGARAQEFVMKAMGESDIFLLPGIIASDGRQENQGLVIQEAQAMELAVVASDTGGIKEGMQHAQSGFLTGPGNENDIADRLEQLIKDPVLRTEMGKKGRLFVSQHFDSGLLAATLIKIYERTLPTRVTQPGTKSNNQ